MREVNQKYANYEACTQMRQSSKKSPAEEPCGLRVKNNERWNDKYQTNPFKYYLCL